MKKLILLLVILVSVLAFDPKPAHAAIGLQAWCIAEGQTWDLVSYTCFVADTATINLSGETLTVFWGETLHNKGTIYNIGGTINNEGSINNEGTIRNDGTVISKGHYGRPPLLFDVPEYWGVLRVHPNDGPISKD
ncbi:MAG: hypothetical protein JSV68_00450, partial [Anaerolineaceae bacterium]